MCLIFVCWSYLFEQPPLPEEDYPQEDYSTVEPPEPYGESVASGYPSTLPKEFPLSQVTRTIIPRASLDRSTPAGWNLSVESNGTWVFTSEHSPEQVGPVYEPYLFNRMLQEVF